MQNYNLKHQNKPKDSKELKNTQICLKHTFWADLNTKENFDENRFQLDPKHLKTQTKTLPNYFDT